jgi:putative SOS response-associated peptidase YedK
MCGRFALKAPPKKLATLFDLPAVPEMLKPRYNVAPTQQIPVVGLKADGATRGLIAVRWGLVPGWSNGPKSTPLHINAKSETVFKLDTFKGPFKEQRCLVPADGFYEWAATGTKKKQPYHFRMRDGEPFAFAGLWDRWGRGPEAILSACILTTGPNDVVRPVHDRMPLILPRSGYARWLSHDSTVAELLALLTPYPAGEMEGYRVGPAVSNAGYDGPECVEPVAAVEAKPETTLF